MSIEICVWTFIALEWEIRCSMISTSLNNRGIFTRIRPRASKRNHQTARRLGRFSSFFRSFQVRRHRRNHTIASFFSFFVWMMYLHSDLIISSRWTCWNRNIHWTRSERCENIIEGRVIWYHFLFVAWLNVVGYKKRRVFIQSTIVIVQFLFLALDSYLRCFR